MEEACPRTIRSIPANVSKVIRAKIDAYAADPAALANVVVAIQGPEFDGTLRMRVGDWRVIMQWDGEDLVILAIGGRGDIYR